MNHDPFVFTMGPDVPLINSYKRAFLKKRLLQTALGGLRVWLSHQPPWYVFLHQFTLFLLPLMLAVLLTALCELSLLPLSVALPLYSSLLLLLCLTTNLLSHCLHRRKASLQSLTPQPRHLLSDHDSLQFDSCCGLETISFVLPGRKYLINVFLHALLTGPVAGLGFWYLLPSETLRLYGEWLWVRLLLYVLGWLSLTLALYSLTSGPPSEPATFRATDPLELSPISRTFHCLLFFAVFILARLLPGSHVLLLADQVLHCVFATLPLLWVLGWFPPVDALLLWACEQVHVFLFGGSPMASYRALLLHLLLTCLLSTITLLVPSGLAALVTCSCFGFLLSNDLTSFCRTFFRACGHMTPTPQEAQFEEVLSGCLWRNGRLKFCLLLVIMLLVGGLTAVVQLFVVDMSLDNGIADYLGFTIVGLFLLQWLLGELQKVYVLGGTVRNRLYPASTERFSVFQNRKKKLRALGLIRRLVVNCIGPFSMVTYLAVETDWSGKELPWEHNNNTTVSAWDVMAVGRAFRWTWQSPSDGLLELSVAHLLSPLSPAFLHLPLASRLLILSLARDRLRQLAHKLLLLLTVLVTSWNPERRRRSRAGICLLLNLLSLPFTLFIVAVATVLSAPIVPLFTLPIFLLGFPRPLRGWGGRVGESANTCQDSALYQQAATEVTRVVREMAANGSLGDPSPGCHFLLRWEDKLVWVEVLERGFLYLKLSLKGLELQETSCHTEEVTKIDDIITETYERPRSQPVCGKHVCNPFPLSVLQPLDVAVMETYTDIRNQLIGVIDTPDIQRCVDEELVRTLTWIIVSHVYWNHKNPQQQESMTLDPKVNGSMKFDREEGSRRPSVTMDRKTIQQSPRTGSPSKSLLASHWTDDHDSLHMETLDTKPSQLIGGSAPLSLDQVIVTMDREHFSKPPDLSTSRLNIPGEVNDLLDELNSASSPSTAFVARQCGNHNLGQDVKTQIRQLKCKCQHSVKMLPPPQWTYTSPLSPGEVSRLLGSFQRDWYRHVVSLLRFPASGGSSSQEVAKEIAADDVLENVIAEIVMGCYAAVTCQGVSGEASRQGPKHIHSVYSGSFPQSALTEWMERNPPLHQLTLQAYRLAVKLSIDQCVLGPASSQEDILENLETYNKKWYIGMETQKEWKDEISGNTPNLFSFTYVSEWNKYYSRVLSIRSLPVSVFSVNGEAVRAQWANLALEMFYLTNDDEERFSIQAEPRLLRNLSVQAADPPLGYPIYYSKPITVPTL